MQIFCKQIIEGTVFCGISIKLNFRANPALPIGCCLPSLVKLHVSNTCITQTIDKLVNLDLHPNQINMVMLFWYLVKSDLFSVHNRYTGHFFTR